jgi:hypothetical protein
VPAAIRHLKKLERYKASYTNGPLLESQDQALMNEYKMLEVAAKVLEAASKGNHDQLWYAPGGVGLVLRLHRPNHQLARRVGLRGVARIPSSPTTWMLSH